MNINFVTAQFKISVSDSVCICNSYMPIRIIIIIIIIIIIALHSIAFKPVIKQAYTVATLYILHGE